METAFVIWALGTLPGIGEALCVIASLGWVAILIIGIPMLADGVKVAKKYMVVGAILFTLMGIVGMITPDKQTAYAMVAGFGIQAIAETPKAQELASDSVDVLSSYLKKAKKEFEQENK